MAYGAGMGTMAATTGGLSTYYSQPSQIVTTTRHLEAPVHMGQTVNTTYLNGGTVIGGAYNDGRLLTESIRAVETIPVTTTIMDGISTTTAVPHYTLKDNLSGAHSYLNYPFGADEAD